MNGQWTMGIGHGSVGPMKRKMGGAGVYLTDWKVSSSDYHRARIEIHNAFH